MSKKKDAPKKVNYGKLARDLGEQLKQALQTVRHLNGVCMVLEGHLADERRGRAMDRDEAHREILRQSQLIENLSRELVTRKRSPEAKINFRSDRVPQVSKAFAAQPYAATGSVAQTYVSSDKQAVRQS